ncbi:MAG: ribulose-phosphate 3-epimerase [Candidatus Margulisbacteria bacterium GWF2_35_9]|nr:MAG: ribulose-phosphate 3-epimerase [Candidatus Margulisbacteria bacterium GWF2_35_9]
MVKIAPSILSANFNDLAHDVKMIDQAGADYIHIDVMDGRFVPNISFGPVVLKRIREVTKKPLDVHLMILEAERYIEEFVKIGADIITVQYEATNHLDRLINLIKSFGVKASVAINPATSIEVIKPIIPFVSQVLIMSVNPGFGGQKFIPYCLDKVKQIKEYIVGNNLNIEVEVDGGVTVENAPNLVKAGVDVLVAGSTVFSSSDIKKTIQNLKSA